MTCNNNYETGSMTGILEQLKWESLTKRRKNSRVYPRMTLFPQNRHTRTHHSLAFQTPLAATDIYKSSFFPQIIRDWNSLTDSLISASECAEDSVTTFTSLVRNPGRFGPIPVRSGRFGPGRFGPFSGVSRFGPVGAGRFGPIS